MSKPGKSNNRKRLVKVVVAAAALLLLLSSLVALPRTTAFFTHNTQSETYTVQFNGEQ